MSRITVTTTLCTGINPHERDLTLGALVSLLARRSATVEVADVGVARHVEHVALAVVAPHRSEFRGPAEFVIAYDPFVGRLRPASAEQVAGNLPGFEVGHVRGDVALLAPHGVVDPVLGQVEPAVQGGVPLGGDVGQEDANLAVLLLAQPAAPLAGYPTTVGALFGERTGIDHNHAVRFRQLLADVPPQFGHDLLVVPDAGADEELEVLAGDARL